VIHGIWKVIGARSYRLHEPGEEFEASLVDNAAARAINRGDIMLVEEIVPALPDSHELPKGWLDQ
jgi:hypothetical protein